MKMKFRTICFGYVIALYKTYHRTSTGKWKDKCTQNMKIGNLKFCLEVDDLSQETFEEPTEIVEGYCVLEGYRDRSRKIQLD